MDIPTRPTPVTPTGQRPASPASRRPASRRSDLLSVLGQLTTRDRQLLDLLDEHEVLTTSQLARLAFPSRSMAQRRLLRLTGLGVFDRFRWHLPAAPKTGATPPGCSAKNSSPLPAASPRHGPPSTTAGSPAWRPAPGWGICSASTTCSPASPAMPAATPAAR